MKYIIIYLFIIDPKLLKSLGAKILNKEKDLLFFYFVIYFSNV